MVDEGQLTQQREALKLHFELFKHLTTLNSASLLLLPALYQANLVSTYSPLVPIYSSLVILSIMVPFSLSLVVSFIAMVLITDTMESLDESYEPSYPYRPLYLALGLFSFGITYLGVAILAA